MNKLEKRVGHHQYIVQGLTELYKEKNQRYGDSFTQTLEEFGTVAVVLRLSDKLNRLKTLWTDPEIGPGDESVIDTLRDLANYSIMTVMYLEEIMEQQGEEPKPNTRIVSKEEFLELLRSEGVLT